MAKYRADYPEKLIDLMSKGYLNLEIAAKLGVAEKTFYDWRERYPEFGEAYEIGYPQQYLWWQTKGREKYLEGDSDKGYKYWHAVMRNAFGYDVNEGKGTTNIHINTQNNILSTKSDAELLELLQDKLNNLKLPDTNMIPVIHQIEAKVVPDQSPED